MNQSLIEASLGRHARKRNSHEQNRLTHTLRNGKKSLPEVFIDLNHPKKHRLNLDDKGHRGRYEGSGEGSRVQQGKKSGAKTGKKKEDQLVRNMCQTQVLRGQDENRNILNEYRDEIELLKLDNERMREENEKLKTSEVYLSRRLREMRQEHMTELQKREEAEEELCIKLEDYSAKIRQLYGALIQEKRRNTEGSIGSAKSREDRQLYIVNHNNVEDSRHKREEPFSHRQVRHVEEGFHTETNNNYKRYASPSYYSLGKKQSARRWDEQQERLHEMESKGKQAYVERWMENKTLMFEQQRKG